MVSLANSSRLLEPRGWSARKALDHFVLQLEGKAERVYESIGLGDRGTLLEAADALVTLVEAPIYVPRDFDPIRYLFQGCKEGFNHYYQRVKNVTAMYEYKPDNDAGQMLRVVRHVLMDHVNKANEELCFNHGGIGSRTAGL